MLQAAKATGTRISTSQMPHYFKDSEPVDYTPRNMEKCVFKCRYMCETGNEIPSVNGIPVRLPCSAHVLRLPCSAHVLFFTHMMSNSFFMDILHTNMEQLEMCLVCIR